MSKTLDLLAEIGSNGKLRTECGAIENGGLRVKRALIGGWGKIEIKSKRRTSI